MRKGFLIYEEKRKYLTINEEAVSHIWLCNAPFRITIYIRKIRFSFLSVWVSSNTTLGLYLNKITVLCVLAWFYFFFRERFKRFYSPSSTETFLAKGFHYFVKEKKHYIYIYFALLFHVFFIFLFSATSVGYEALVLVGKNEHIHFFFLLNGKSFVKMEEMLQSVQQKKLPNVAFRKNFCKHFFSCIFALLDD